MHFLKLFVVLPLLASLVSCGGSTETAPVSEAKQAATIDNAAVVYQVDPAASTLTWIGKKYTGGEHNGTIVVSGGELAVTEGLLQAGSFKLDIANGVTVLDIEDPEKNKKLLGHLMSDDFLGAEAHPEGSFAITKVAVLEGNAEATHQISGNLTIKGITHEISFPTKVSLDAETLQAQASFAIDRNLWNISFRSGLEAFGDKTILDEIPISINLVAKTVENGVVAN